MAQLLEFIGNFFTDFFNGILTLFNFFSTFSLFELSSVALPSFFMPIVSSVLAIALVMWVINLL